MGQANICEDALTDLIINWQRDQELGHVLKRDVESSKGDSRKIRKLLG